MSLAFRTLGGSGEDVVLLHGFGSDRLSWLATSPPLMALGRVHSLDLPGHGDSGAEVGNGSPATLATMVRESLDAAGLQRAHFVGHSLGAGLALMLAAQDPSSVASLSLIAPAGLGAGLDEVFLRAYPDLADRSEAVLLLQRLVVKPQVMGKQVVQRVLDQLAVDGMRQALRTVAAALLKATPDLELAAQFVRERNMPRLTLWGNDDAINPLSPRRLKQFGGEQFIVPDAGHLPHIESVAAVNARLVDFIAASIRS